MSQPLDAAGYACLFAAHPRAAALRSLYAWADTIDDLVASGRTRSHEPAHHKLQWWQKELQRLQAGTPVHPTTRNLQQVAPEPGLWSALSQRLDLAGLELGGVAPDDEADAERWDWRRHGALQWTAIRLLVPAESTPEELTHAPLQRVAESLGRALGRLEACILPLSGARLGRLGLPLAALEARGIAVHELPEALAAAHHAESLAGVIADQLAIAAAALAATRQLWRELPQQLRSELRHTAVRLTLAERAVIRFQATPQSATPERLLPPWRTLWAAWHAARTAHR